MHKWGDWCVAKLVQSWYLLFEWEGVDSCGRFAVGVLVWGDYIYTGVEYWEEDVFG